MQRSTTALVKLNRVSGFRSVPGKSVSRYPHVSSYASSSVAASHPSSSLFPPPSSSPPSPASVSTSVSASVSVSEISSHGLWHPYRMRHANPQSRAINAFLAAIRNGREENIWKAYMFLNSTKQLSSLTPEQHSMTLRSFRLKSQVAFGPEEVKKLKKRLLFVLGTMDKNGVQLDVRDYNHVLEFFGRIGDWNTCCDYWHRINSDEKGLWDVHPDAFTYNNYMYAALKSKKPVQVFNILGMMRKANVQPNEYTYTTLIKAHGMLGDIKAADDVFRTFFHSTATSPSKSFFSFAIFTKFSGSLQKYLLDMDSINSSPPPTLVSPSIHTFIALVDAHGRNGNLKGLEYIQNTMLPAANIQPTPQFYQHLVRWYCKHSDVESATAVFGVMEKQGMTPSISTFNYLFRQQAHKGRQVKKAEMILDYMKHIYNLSPLPSMYRSLIKIHLKHNREDKVHRLYDDYKLLKGEKK
ncbi:hypothetical protein BDF14DRAFT_1962203 [Spinellus fusiger]|nr:hypothetical protein BDF14DRAFT_1962203 [Spinellus fusiger]